MKTKAGIYLIDRDYDALAIVYPDGSYDFGDINGNFFKNECNFPVGWFVYLCDLDGNLEEEATQNKNESKLFDIELRKSFEAIRQDWGRLNTFPQPRPEFNRVLINIESAYGPLKTNELDPKGSDTTKTFDGGMTKAQLAYCFFALVGLCLIGGIFWNS